MEKIVVKEKEISITGSSDDDYISLTDIARIKNDKEPRFVIQRWMRTKNTIDFLGLWEILNNKEFNRVEFDAVKNQYGRKSFAITPSKWISSTKAIGIRTRTGKYNSGTYAHKDIALEFASWISPELKLYIIKEFQRLKIKETSELEWKGNRFLARLNYLIHTETIKAHLITIELDEEQISYIYATEADLLNVALFGKRASE